MSLLYLLLCREKEKPPSLDFLSFNSSSETWCGRTSDVLVLFLLIKSLQRAASSLRPLTFLPAMLCHRKIFAAESFTETRSLLHQLRKSFFFMICSMRLGWIYFSLMPLQLVQPAKSVGAHPSGQDLIRHVSVKCWRNFQFRESHEAPRGKIL